MKKYILYVPDISIKSSIEIINILDFKKIKIYTSAIYNKNKKIGESHLNKLKKHITNNKISTLIIYESTCIPKYELNILINLCSKCNCKLYFLNNMRNI